MALGQPLRPEDATSWDDFLDRIAQERSALGGRSRAIAPLRWVCLAAIPLVLSVAMSSYAADWNGRWWEWPAVLVSVTVVIRMAFAAEQRAERDDKRRGELDRLELGWKSHLEHPRH